MCACPHEADEVVDRLRAFADATCEAIAISEHGRVIDANPQFAALFGYTLAEVVGLSAADLASPQDRELICGNNRANVTSPYQALSRRKDGTLFPCEFRGRPVRYQGRPVRATAVRDITYHRQTAEALHQAQGALEERVTARTAELAAANAALQQEAIERQWAEVELQRVLTQSEQILASISSILIAVDCENNITTWNAAARRAFGLSTDEALGRRFRECGIPWDWDPVDRAVAECRATQKPTRADAVSYTDRGEERFLGITVNPIGGFSDVFCGFLLLAADITERLKTEGVLREREAHLHRSNSVLRAQQEAAPDGILVVDENRRIVGYNRRLCELWYTPQEIIEAGDDARHLDYVLSLMRHPEEFLARVMHLYEHPQESSHEEIELRDGRILDRYSGPLCSETGWNFGRIWYFRDVTERKLLESQLTHAQKMESIGHLAAGIAHELNTPIQYVGDNTRFLQDAFVDLGEVLGAYDSLAAAVRAGADTAQALAAVEAAAEKADMNYLTQEIPVAVSQSLDGVDRVAHIVRAMKDFSHPGTTQMTAVDLNRCIESTITVAHNEWKYVADVRTELDPLLPPVLCLPSELNQVFLNMLVNAAHAIGDVVGDTGDKGKIVVSTRAVPPEAPTHAEVRIADSGTGIPPEIRARIFDPFFTTKGVGRGTGQGLAISHAIVVDKHGGTIACESEVGRGTTFVIRLSLKGASSGP